jgi:hypothetical protein
VAQEFTYEETDVPVGLRTGGKAKDPNPHEAIVLHLFSLVGSGSDEKRARTLVVPHVDENGYVLQEGTTPSGKVSQVAPVARAIRQLRAPGDDHKDEQGNPAPFSVRTDVKSSTALVTDGSGSREVPASRITFWVHTRRDEQGNETPARITRTEREHEAADA